MESPRGTIYIALVALFAIGVVWPAHGALRAAPPQQAVISAGSAGEATGVCPAGASVISGGFESLDFSMEGASTVRYASARAGKRRWRIDAVGLGEATGRMVAHAYCERAARSKSGRRAARVRVRTASTPIAPMGIGSATASCRGRERAISGGFASPGFALAGGSHVIALSSHRVGKRGWRVDAVNFDFEEGQTVLGGEVVAYAYCRIGGPKVIERRTTVTVAGDVSRTADARCPRNTHAVSGGFDGNLVIDRDGLRASGAIGSVRLPVAAGWRNTVISVADGAPAEATVFAYCARAPR